jgi:Holliday junction resolvase RusA-like endonuclease
MQFTIPLNPTTKKNSQQMINVGGRIIPVPSKQYKQYHKDCKWYIPKVDKPINERVNVKATYYRQTRHKVDLNNLHSALHDILKDYKVVEDDNSDIIAGTDGSRVRYDKDNPRTEVTITELIEIEGE